MSLNHFVALFRPEIEKDLQYSLESNLVTDPILREMLFYHMGWSDLAEETKSQGKRIRPLLTLLCGAASGGDWRNVLPAASAIELLHNFSLIHDDIEDGGRLRHGRPALWVKWGTAQALNAGDALFTLAHLTLLRLSENKNLGSEKILEGMRVFDEACLQLTMGQRMDISFESAPAVSTEAYWQMVKGKTAALLACSAEIGAMVAGAETAVSNSFHQFGLEIGLAFQAWDDYLGIWGDEALTGKSTDSDLVAGKKSLPVLYGLEQKGAFYDLWSKGPIHEEEAPIAAEILAKEGAREFVVSTAKDLTYRALRVLSEIDGEKEAETAIVELTEQLLGRVH